VAIDSGHIFWTNYIGNTIGRANLDGTGANHSFIGGASGPVGLAVSSG
jgi:virginiamycin B lyase